MKANKPHTNVGLIGGQLALSRLALSAAIASSAPKEGTENTLTMQKDCDPGNLLLPEGKFIPPAQNLKNTLTSKDGRRYKTLPNGQLVRIKEPGSAEDKH